MKTFQLLLYFILFTPLIQGCIMNRPLPEISDYDNDKCEYNGELTVKQRSKIYPFNKAVTIQIVSFNSGLESVPIENDTINRVKTEEIITLNQEQINSLTDILYNYNYKKTDGISVHNEVNNGCYRPRHAILFLDDKNKVKEFIEICFECSGYESRLNKDEIGEFCEGKYDLLHTFFENTGINYFEELPRNEIELK